ncbi:hypothetical protein [Agrilutibacter solisilvae]|uniref:Uncharacterized protein n=1 Tax=Agrilutibacter solisilvae TaxID=2763317 RepID=A0A974Y3V5_9GAMM|nr:hypothetical protein [Lysobacter solisilvae]QSX77356.1 hypothetical protein I8J32_011320 [Lysobacter solisilvae]
MSRTFRLAATFGAPLLLAFAALAPTPARAQDSGTVLVAIYRIAPGKHLDFLRWQAARDAAAAEAGVGATQWYAHVDGDSWDFVSIAPVTTQAQDEKVQGILAGKHLTTGYKASLEFRSFISSHTDTYARGPTTAAALVDAGK